MELPTWLSLSEKAQRKGLELLRLARLRCPSLGKGEICRPVVCAELACMTLGESFDRAEGMRRAGVDKRTYLLAFSSLQNLLGVRPSLTVRELAVRFGSVRLIPLVQRVINTYKERFLRDVPPERRPFAEFPQPILVAVAFYLCSKKEKLRVDQQKLWTLSGCQHDEFCKVKHSMMEICFDMVGTAKRKKDVEDVKSNRELVDVVVAERKRRGECTDEVGSDFEEEDEEEDDKEEHQDVHVGLGKRRRRDRYEEWKRKVLGASSSSSPPRGPLRQTGIGSYFAAPSSPP